MTTITRADIADSICEEIGLSRKDAGDILDMVVDEIRGELTAGRDVKISTFGSFLLKHKNARVGRTPKSGVEACADLPITFIQFYNNKSQIGPEIPLENNKAKIPDYLLEESLPIMAVACVGSKGKT